MMAKTPTPMLFHSQLESCPCVPRVRAAYRLDISLSILYRLEEQLAVHLLVVVQFLDHAAPEFDFPEHLVRPYEPRKCDSSL